MHNSRLLPSLTTWCHCNLLKTARIATQWERGRKQNIIFSCGAAYLSAPHRLSQTWTDWICVSGLCYDGWGVHVMHAFIYTVYGVHALESMHCMHTNVQYSCKHWTWFTVLLCRTLDVTLDLKDPQYPENNLGSLDLAVTLSPKEGDMRDAVRKLYEISIRLLIHLSVFLHTLHFLLIQGNRSFLSYLPCCTPSLSCHTKMKT